MDGWLALSVLLALLPTAGMVAVGVLLAVGYGRLKSLPADTAKEIDASIAATLQARLDAHEVKIARHKTANLEHIERLHRELARLRQSLEEALGRPLTTEELGEDGPPPPA